jgi:hypothetical protein
MVGGVTLATTRSPRRAGPALLLAVAALVVTAAVVAVDTQPPATAAAPRAHRVFRVSDAVGLGAKTALPNAFPADWEVNVVGTPAMFVEQLESSWVKPQLAANPWMFGDHVVVAGGYNYPYWDPARFDRSIDSMIATLAAAGVKNVYWVTLREVKPWFISPSAWRQVQPYYWYFPTVNDHLERAVARHPNLTLVDWAAAADRPGITYDAIHLNTTGAALYSGLIANAVHNANTRRPNGAVTRVAIPDAANTAAVALNVTATGTRRNGFYAAYPCDEPRPEASNLNHGRDHTVAASAIVPVGPSGEICIYNHQAGQVIVDLFGRFTDAADLADRAPTRLIDTRTNGGARQKAGATRSLVVTGANRAPPGTRTVALNVTATGATRLGHITVHPCSISKPNTSNVNFRPGVAVPNLVIAEPAADGRVCLSPSADVHLVVDLFASFGPATDITLADQYRVLDTRTAGATPPPARSVQRIGAAALAPAVGGATGHSLFLNLTVTGAAQRGFATVYGCDDGRPATSNINFTPGVNVANLVTVRPDADGDVCVYTHTATHVVVDVLGNAGTGFEGRPPIRLLDTRG